MLRRALLVLSISLMFAIIPVHGVLAEPNGLHGSVSIPSLGVEADLGWSWQYPEFCNGCGWWDGTFWPTHNVIGFHAPERNALYKATPGMIVTVNGVYTWAHKDYIVTEVDVVDSDYLFEPPASPELYIIICYPDRPWPQRLVIHLIEVDKAEFNRILEEYRTFVLTQLSGEIDVTK